MPNQPFANATSTGSSASAALSDTAIPATAKALPVAEPAAQAAGQAASQIATPASHSGSLLESLQQGSAGGYLEMLAMFFLVLAALWFTLWLLKRFGGKYFPGNAPLQIESRLSIAPKRWIMVVRVESKRLVLGVSDEHITLLTELAEEEDLPHPAKFVPPTTATPQPPTKPAQKNSKKKTPAPQQLPAEFAEMFAEITKDKKG